MFPLLKENFLSHRKSKIITIVTLCLYINSRWNKYTCNFFRGVMIHIICSLPIEGDEEIKLEINFFWKSKMKSSKKQIVTRSKFLTPNKLLTRLSILLAQTKARNNSNKLKNEIRQILYHFFQHSKITKKIYNNLIKLL